MKTIILCGGRGIRAHPHTVDMPKALLEVGERPVLRHLMEIYARQGFTEFVLAAGFKVTLIEIFAEGLPRNWDVEVVDTGLDTPTGKRLEQCRPWTGGPHFVTYGDGLADIDLDALLRFHQSHDSPVTVTTVPLPSPFGVLDVDDDGRVRSFTEKPRLEDHWINAGFLVMDETAIGGLWWRSDLEKETLPLLASHDYLCAYRHTGFWRSLDTWKDAMELDALCEDGRRPPWRVPRKPRPTDAPPAGTSAAELR